MNLRRYWNWCAAAGLAGMFGILCVARAEPESPDKPAENKQRVTLAVARDRADLMHRVYAATLDVMHERYFHGERAIVPARAMEDVFEEIAKESKISARWISVNTKAMSVHHEPRDAFEKDAAKAIAAGKGEFERIEKGQYRRAAAIPLTSGCVSCHTGFFGGAPSSPRFAGLVIGIPIVEEELTEE